MLGWVSTPTVSPRLVAVQIDSNGLVNTAKILDVNRRVSLSSKFTLPQEGGLQSSKLNGLRFKVLSLQAGSVPFQATVLYSIESIERNRFVGPKFSMWM